MKTFLKITGIVIAVLLAAVIIIPMALKPKIGEIVKYEANKMLEARLDFDKLDLSLIRHFPHASVELKGLTLVGTERFEGDTIVAANRISVVVDLMSLFGDSGYEVTKLLLDRPAIYARKTADGAVNWDVMKSADDAEPEPEEEENDTPSSFRLQIRDFRISDAAVSYADDSTGMYFAARPLDLRLRGDMSASQTDLDVALSLGGMNFTTGDVKLVNNAEFELKAVVAADFANGRYTLSDNTLRLNAVKLGIDGWVQTGDDALSMDIAMNSSKVAFKDILSMIPAFYTKDFKDLAASGNLVLGAWAKGEMKGDKLPAFGLKLEVADGSFKYAALPKSVDNINIIASVANDGGTLDDTKADVSEFTLSVAGNSLSATLSAARPVSDLQFKATADGVVDLGAVRDVYPLGEDVDLAGKITVDLGVAGRMSDIEKQRYESIAASGMIGIEGVTVALKGMPDVKIGHMTAVVSPKAMELRRCDVTVGASDLSATGSLSDYIGYFLRGDTLKGSLKLNSKLLDVNELLAMMPADDGEAAADGGTAAANGGADEPMAVVEVPKNLKLSLAVDMSEILFRQMTLRNFVGRMGVADGTVSIDKLAVDAFGGKMSASGRYSTAENPESPKLDLVLDIDKAKFGETFRQLDMVRQIVPVFEKTGGDYSMKMTMATSLTSEMGVDFDSFNASGVIRSENIEVSNIAALDALAKALNDDRLRDISAKDVKISFTVKNGRVTTAPFDIRMGNVSMNLSGSTGLDQTIDYVGKVTLPEKAGGGILNTVNVNIGGTFTAPKVGIDVKEAAKEAVTNIVNQQVQKLTGSADLNEEFEKQAAKLREEADKAGRRLVEEAEKQRGNLIDKASGTFGKIAAEKSGDALVKAAEKQAEKLKAEAEVQIEKLRSGMSAK